jgi:hypothetical protein
MLHLTGVSYNRSMGRSGREHLMYRAIVGQPLWLGVLVTLAILALHACSGAGGQEQAKAQPLPEKRQDLHPGEYRSEEFKPSLTFRLGKEWANDPPEVSEELGLTWRWKGTANLYFFNFQKVIERDKSGFVENVDAPKNMVSWFQHHPYLHASKPKPVTVGGVEGKQFDVVPEVPDDYYGDCSNLPHALPGCLDISNLTGGSGMVAFAEGYTERIIVLDDVKGETETIDFGAPAGKKFDEFTSETQKVLDTVKWTGS